MICLEGFKDSIKKFGKTAALSGMLGLASLGAMSCSDPSSNDDVCNHNYVFVDENGDGVIDDEDWIDGIKPDADHIGKKHRNCSKCNLSDVVDDASKFVSHQCGIMEHSWWIVDKDDNVKWDKWDNDNGGDPLDGIVHDENGNSEECKYNLLARTPGDYYGKKHSHNCVADSSGKYKYNVTWEDGSKNEIDNPNY